VKKTCIATSIRGGVSYRLDGASPGQEVLGGTYHVAARGNCGQDIFRDDRDRDASS
jgi:hypothetical protein